MTRLVTPSVHLNGTSKEGLVKQLLDAIEAARQLHNALHRASPNARDNYPQGAGDANAAEMNAAEIPHPVVVVTGNIDHLSALAGHAQDLLNDVVVGLRPIPACTAQSPAVDDVADEKIGVGVIVPQEIEHKMRLTAPRAKMHIRQENGAVVSGGGGIWRHGHRLVCDGRSLSLFRFSCRRDDRTPAWG